LSHFKFETNNLIAKLNSISDMLKKSITCEFALITDQFFAMLSSCSRCFDGSMWLLFW